MVRLREEIEYKIDELKEWLKKESVAFSDLVEKLCLELEELKLFIGRGDKNKNK